MCSPDLKSTHDYIDIMIDCRFIRPALWVLLVILGQSAISSGFSFEQLVTLVNFDELRQYGINILDTSNDDAAHLSTQKIIERAGFEFENHHALADDGYVTQLIRIINPLADRTQLKQPPIMIQHGQTANSRNFVMQSNSQHHPMPWPPRELSHRQQQFFGDDLLDLDAFRPSSNRSLALMLANNGYDVWLSSTRGVDKNNKGFVKSQVVKSLLGRRNQVKNMTLGEDWLMLRRVHNNYWSFTLDDQIAHEMPSQISQVLKVTGADRLTLVGYSNTALTTFAMLSTRPDIGRRVDTYIAMAPVVYYSRIEGFLKWFMMEFTRLVPRNLDVELFLSDQMADFLRRLVSKVCANMIVRYTLCKSSLDLMFGQSSQFQTNLELPFLGHLFWPTSWKCLAQHLQIAQSNKLRKFDYGRKRNLKYYGSARPPTYNISAVHPNIKLVLVSGDRDSWANPATLNDLRRNLGRRADLDLVLDGYNHLDLVAAFDVDERVNLPVLGFLDRRHLALVGHSSVAVQTVDESSPLDGLFKLPDLGAIFRPRPQHEQPPTDGLAGLVQRLTPDVDLLGIH